MNGEAFQVPDHLNMSDANNVHTEFSTTITNSLDDELPTMCRPLDSTGITCNPLQQPEPNSEVLPAMVKDSETSLYSNIAPLQANACASTHRNPEEHIFCCDDFQIENYNGVGHSHALGQDITNCLDGNLSSSDNDTVVHIPTTFQGSETQNSVNCILVPSSFFEARSFGEGSVPTSEANPVPDSGQRRLTTHKAAGRIQVQRCGDLQNYMRVIDNIGGKGRLYQCTQCEKIFKGSYELDRHVRVHTGERPYVCNICGKGFALTSNYYKHVRKHESQANPAMFRKRKTQENSAMSRKNETQQNNPSMSMSTSSIAIDSPSISQILESPAKKMKAKPNKKPGLFGQRVAVKRSDNLKDFMKIVEDSDGKTRHQCTRCSKLFKGSYELDRHIRVHTGERPYVCPVCHKGFKLTSNLYKHTRVHANTKQSNK